MVRAKRSQSVDFDSMFVCVCLCWIEAIAIRLYQIPAEQAVRVISDKRLWKSMQHLFDGSQRQTHTNNIGLRIKQKKAATPSLGRAC